MNNSFLKIIKAGIIVGTLDILSAFLHDYIKTGETHFFVILRFIASGIFGKKAFSGGTGMVLSGIILHYLIAFAFSIFFFWLYPKIKWFSKNKVLTGTLYGIFIWVVMNLIIVPLSHVPPGPFSISNALISVIILIVAIGIPLSFMAYASFKKTNPESVQQASV